MPQRCTYSFPDDHTHEVADAAVGDWRCPHGRHEDSRFCIFHMPVEEKERRGIDAERVKQELEERIQGRGKARKQFIGARFRDLDLSHYVFTSSDNYPVDLSHAVIKGDMDLSHAEFVQPLVAEQARINGNLKASKSSFRRYVRLNGAAVDRFVDMSDSVFDEELNCREMVFDGVDTNQEYPDFVASFRGSALKEKAVFQGTRFHGRVDFRDAVVRDGVFHATTFDVAFFGSARLERIAVSAPRALDSEAYLSFVNAHVEEGVLNQPYYLEDGIAHYPEESIYYNMDRATLGDVELLPDADDRLFEYFHINETEFQGFEFANHEAYLRPDWDLHSYEGPMLPEGNVHSDLRMSSPNEAGNAELTYMKAKEGARARGHTTSASEFFRNQVRQRKYGYRQELWDASRELGERVMAGLRLFGHHVNGLVSGHFERPWRVIGTSIVVTLLFAAVFPLAGGIGVSETGSVIRYSMADGLSGIWGPFQESLYFSSTTFTTLGYGDMFPVGAAKHLAVLEAKIGALLMALFIFVLGRRVS